MGKMVVLVGVLVLLLVQFRGELREAMGLPAEPGMAMPATLAATNRQPDLIVYSTPTCGVCRQARRYFSERGIAYEERDVTRNSRYEEEWRRHGGRGVPLFLINGTPFSGFNPQVMDQRLR